MIYLRVKPQYDNYRRNIKGDIFVGNELYTIKEFEKIKKEYHKNISDFYDIFEQVSISKKRVYWFFGARFEMED